MVIKWWARLAIYWLRDHGTQLAGRLTINRQAEMLIDWQAGSHSQLTGQESRSGEIAVQGRV